MRCWQRGFWKWCDLTAVLVARIVGLRMANSARGLHTCLLYCRGQKGQDSLLTWLWLQIEHLQAFPAAPPPGGVGMAEMLGYTGRHEVQYKR